MTDPHAPRALVAFVEWLRGHTHIDRAGRLPSDARISLHSRSDAHSVQLMKLVLNDLLDQCPLVRDQAAQGEIAYGINYAFQWPNGKLKTLDFVFGIPLIEHGSPTGDRIHRLRSRAQRGRVVAPPDQQFSRLLVSCEAKAVLTEHSKSQPRVFDELNGSHAIVHGGSRDTIAAGITLINIADSFVSPLRQRPDQLLAVAVHRQPDDAARMVEHLRGLPRRTDQNPVGFDAYCSFVADVDNQGRVALWTAPPAPQAGDSDHYDAFLSDICRCYTNQFSDLANLPDPSGMSAEEALQALARRYPGLLDDAGQLAVDQDLAGASELHAILRAIELQVRAENGR